MEWNVDFELTRLHMLLAGRLVPGCMELTLDAEEVKVLEKEIRFEGDKIYVEVMKVMCRPHSDPHLRRYLEVHRSGAEHLKEQVEEMLAEADELCREIFEVFEQVLVRVLDRLGKWQKRYFSSAPEEQLEETEDWWGKEKVLEILNISPRTLYTYTKEGLFDSRKFGRIRKYSRESVMRLK